MEKSLMSNVIKVREPERFCQNKEFENKIDAKVNQVIFQNMENK
jgi:hypothetical protein